MYYVHMLSACLYVHDLIVLNAVFNCGIVYCAGGTSK